MRMVPRKHFECSNCFSPTATLNWMSRRKWMSSKFAKSRKFSYWFFPSIYELFKVENENLFQNLKEEKSLFFFALLLLLTGAPLSPER